MQLTTYKYIKNQKPRFNFGDEQGTTDEDYKNKQPGSLNNHQNLNMDDAAKQQKGAAIGNAITNTVGFAGDVINNFQTKAQNSADMLNNAGYSQGSISGVGYESQNGIDVAGEQAELSAKNSASTMKSVGTGVAAGASIGMAFGPLGGAIGAVAGGLFGGVLGGAAAQKRKQQLRRNIFNAQQSATRTNIFNRSVAQSTAMQQDYYTRNGDTRMGMLNANRGKDMPRYNSGKSKVWTPDGYMAGPHNSWVGKGESIVNFNDGKASMVEKGTVGVDNQKSSVQESDDNVILGNDVDWSTGRTFAEQAAPYTQKVKYITDGAKKILQHENKSSLSKRTQELYDKLTQEDYQNAMGNLKQLADKQAKQHNVQEQMNNYAPMYNNGKSPLPRFTGGKAWQDYARIGIPSALGVAEGIGRAISANGEQVKYNDTYRANPYAGRALQGLNSLRYNIYPELREYGNALRQSKYALDQTGGLTGGQKLLARTSMYNDYVNNISKLYQTADKANNQYKSDYYAKLLSTGEADREAMTNARRYDTDAYAKAKAAKLAMKQQAMKDVMENVYRADKRIGDWMMWDRNRKLWETDINNKNPKKEQSTTSTTPATSTVTSGATSYVPFDFNGYSNYVYPGVSRSVPYHTPPTALQMTDWRSPYMRGSWGDLDYDWTK